MTNAPGPMKLAVLADRGVVSVQGEDAEKLLQGLITNDMAVLSEQPALFTGLLSPQGKILFEFFVVRAAGGLLLEVAKEQAAGLVRRLTMYKLRAKVAIADASEAYKVAAAWGPGQPGSEPLLTPNYPDPRCAAVGNRLLLGAQAAARLDGIAKSHASDYQVLSADHYHAHRIALAIPEGGMDYAFGDAFPHEADFDQLGGISFEKGCFVGQEVVSRMQHRGTARKRIVPVAGAAALPATGSDIRAGEAAIGSLGSTARTLGLAMVRLDRAAEALAAGRSLTAGGVEIHLRQPAWATFKVPTKAASSAKGGA